MRSEQRFARFEVNAVRTSSPAAFLFAFRSRRAPPPWWWGITEAQASRERGRSDGSGQREVVQRCEGVRFHLSGGWRGCVRALQRHSGFRIQESVRGGPGRVRGKPGSEGAPGLQRPQDLRTATPGRALVTQGPARSILPAGFRSALKSMLTGVGPSARFRPSGTAYAVPNPYVSEQVDI